MLSRVVARTLLLCCLAFGTGAYAAQDANVNYEKALQAYHEGNYEEAYIHLKNALQADPNLISARLLLAQVDFNAGDIYGAEKESAEALLLGADINLVLPVYGQSLLLQGKTDELFELEKVADSFTPDSQFEWALLKGQGYLLRGERDLAQGEFERAATLLPENVRSNNTLAAIYMNSGMNDEARALIERSLQIEPDNQKVWELRGELAFREKDFDKALEYFRKGYELDPEDLKIQRSLARLYMQLGDRENAQKYLELILEQSPEDPAATLISAILLIGEGNSVLGDSMLASLSSKLSQFDSLQEQSDDAMLFIQASAEYVQRNDATAISLFNAYLAKNRDDISALRLLADLYLRNGEIKQATELLGTREELVATDLGLSVQLLNLYVLSRNIYGADLMLAHLKQNGVGDNPFVLTLEAELLRAKGQPDAALELLNGRDFGDKEPVSYGLLRGALQLDLKQYTDAQSTAQRLQQAFPENLKVSNFAAVTYLTLGKIKDAQAAVEKSLQLAPADIDARFNQAMLYKKQGDLEESGKILRGIVGDNPDHTRSMLLMARILLLQGKYDEAIDWTDKVYAYEGGSSMAGELQLEIYSRTGDWQKARLVAQRLVRDNPQNSDYLLRLSAIAVQLKDSELTRNTLSRLYPLWHQDAGKLRELAALQVRSGNKADARKSLETALSLDEHSYPVRLDLARLDLAEDQYDNAERSAAALQKEFGERSESSSLLGEIALERNDPTLAQQRFMEAFVLDKSNTEAIARLYELSMQGIGAEAFTDALEKTLRESSLPPWAVRLMADSYLAQGKPSRALVYYEKLLALEDFAADPGLLNNLANIYAVDDLDKALVTARKGLDAAGSGQSAALLDTVGWILARQGENEQALSYLRKAYARNSTDPEIRYHTAVTLLALGRTAEAQAELRAALASGQQFTGRADAERLLNGKSQ
ncbi:MAG: PEP-CTERM system TPR-repeat protein PrsT [Halioglobus sp.]